MMTIPPLQHPGVAVAVAECANPAPAASGFRPDTLAQALPLNTDAAIVRRFNRLPSLVRRWLLSRGRYEIVTVHRLREIAADWRTETQRYKLGSHMLVFATEQAQAFEAALRILDTGGTDGSAV